MASKKITKTKYKVHSKEIPYVLGRYLGSGGFGQVYELKGEKNKIIKISRYMNANGCDDYDQRTVDDYRKLFKTLKGAESNHICKLHYYKVIKRKNKFRYFYISERLYKTSYKTYLKFRDKFLNKMISNNLHFLDCHSGNVMQTKKGAPKICDLDAIFIR